MEGYFMFIGGLSSSLCNGRYHYNICSRTKIDLHLRGDGDEKHKGEAF
jgi:hypothetical protein